MKYYLAQLERGSDRKDYYLKHTSTELATEQAKKRNPGWVVLNVKAVGKPRAAN